MIVEMTDKIHVRHSGEGRNPVILSNMPLGFAPVLRGFFIRLDSSLRRNDVFFKGSL
jgi:hypothetical protein